MNILLKFQKELSELAGLDLSAACDANNEEFEARVPFDFKAIRTLPLNQDDFNVAHVELTAEDENDPNLLVSLL